MSGLPITSTLNSLPGHMKAATVSSAAPPVSAAPAVAKTMTATAVQQMRDMDASAAMQRNPLPTAQEKRARLVGPPPTFEVNVLQHMRETLDVTEAPARAESNNATQDMGGTPMPEEHAAQMVYDTLGGLGTRAEESARATIDKVI
ncbi:MAG: hypothetical protein JJU24_17780 [Natronohydrobacter sp.]|nr:hypothetical protein [Natronohydrobacter sp.]